MGRKKDEAIALTEMSKDELIAFAEENKIEINPDLGEDEILEMIQAAMEADSGEKKEGDQDAPSGADTENKSPDKPAQVETALEAELGSIRTEKGVEMVFVGQGGWVPTVRPGPAGKPVVVECRKRAGKTVFAKSGKPITFDENGKATVSAIDGEYLSSIVKDNAAEYKIVG